MARIILPRNIEVVVASFGGVGTSFLISYLEQYKKTNSPVDEDQIKHLPLPPISFNPNAKFVYIYGNPQLAAISLFNRGYHRDQSEKTQRYISRNTSPIPVEMTLEEYAAFGSDRFFFEDHFHNWYDKYLTTIPTMFIRYENLFDNVALLLDFLDMPKTNIDSFPKKKERSSSLSGIPVETRKKLDVIYNDFSSELSRLDDVEIRQTGKRKMFSTTYLKKPYISAIGTQYSYPIKVFLRRLNPRMYTKLKNIIKKLIRRSS